jgi:hypothetical protein
VLAASAEMKDMVMGIDGLAGNLTDTHDGGFVVESWRVRLVMCVMEEG